MDFSEILDRVIRPGQIRVPDANEVAHLNQLGVLLGVTQGYKVIAGSVDSTQVILTPDQPDFTILKNSTGNFTISVPLTTVVGFVNSMQSIGLLSATWTGSDITVLTFSTAFAATDKGFSFIAVGS